MKYKILKKIEVILPWLVLLPGIPAICYFGTGSKEYFYSGSTDKYIHLSEMFKLFYDLAMIVGIVIVILEILIGFVCIILSIINLLKYKKIDNNVKTCFVLGVKPILYSFGTLILMFIVHAFTYGMGV